MNSPSKIFNSCMSNENDTPISKPWLFLRNHSKTEKAFMIVKFVWLKLGWKKFKETSFGVEKIWIGRSILPIGTWCV